MTVETNLRRHIVNNVSRGILGWLTKEISEGLPVRYGRPPGSDPAERIGAKRDVIQEWYPDPDHPERNREFEYKTQRRIEQTYTQVDGRDYLTNSDPDKPVYDWLPRVQDMTYQNYPSDKDYSKVKERTFYLKSDQPPRPDHPRFVSAP